MRSKMKWWELILGALAVWAILTVIVVLPIMGGYLAYLVWVERSAQWNQFWSLVLWAVAVALLITMAHLSDEENRKW